MLHALTQHGFDATRLASTGGFLAKENTTVFLGVDEERVQQAIDLIKAHTRDRRQATPLELIQSGSCPKLPAELVVGGATIFVLDIEYFERA